MADSAIVKFYSIITQLQNQIEQSGNVTSMMAQSRADFNHCISPIKHVLEQ